MIEIRQRVYRGKFAALKNGLVRTIAVPPSTASLLRDWMEKAVDQSPETYVFAGETGQPLWRSSLLEDHIRAKLEPIGLGWVGVALDVYIKSSTKDRATAAKQLEDSVLTKAIQPRKRSA